MLAFLSEWLNLLVRWAHLIAGVSWIGTSFYFIALDLSLRSRARMNPGVTGTAWEVHGGGFYHVEKYAVAPDSLPDDLIWFKWEAYLTWATGFALLVVQFYLQPGAWLIDPEVMALEPWQAIGLSLASLAAGWAAYEGLCRSPIGPRPVPLAAAVLALILAAAWFYAQVFSGRSALVHVGALVGTIMAANVFAIIIPNQRKAVAALIAGRQPDPRHGAFGKQRSVHNTYLTLPVLLLMVSGHYPLLTGHPRAWLVVAAIVVGGAATRHLLVRHEVGDPLSKVAWTIPIIAAALLVAVWLTSPTTSRPPAPGAAATLPATSDLVALTIVDKHCVSCHAARPTHPGFNTPPKGIALDSVDALRRYGPLVLQQAVITRVMPLGNATGMTEEEREQLGRWLEPGPAR